MKYLENLYKILFIILPISLVLGPFSLGLSLSLQCILFVIIIRNKILLIIKDKLVLLFILFSLYLIFDSLLSSNVLRSLESSLFYFRFGVFTISVAVFLNNFESSTKIFAYILNIIVIFLIIDGIYQYVTQFDLFGFPQKGNRLSGPFKGEYILGSVIAKLLPILLISNLYFFGNNFKNFIYIFSIIFLSGIVILLSGERWASFYFIIYIFILSLTFNYKIMNISLRNFSISSITLILLLFLFVTFSSYYTPPSGIPIKKRLIDFTIEQLNPKENEKYFEDNKKELKYTSFSQDFRILSIEHQSFYESAIRIFLDNKLIGVGPKLFRVICKDEKYQVKLKHNSGLIYNGCQTHPHNFYLQLLSETGIIGTIPILIFFIFLSYLLFMHLLKKYLYNQYYLTNNELILLVPLFIIFFPILPGSNFFGSWNSFFIYFIFGFFLKNRYNLIILNK